MTTLRAIDYCGFLPDEVAFPEAVADDSGDPHEDLANGVTLMEKGWAILVVAVAAAIGVILVLAVRA